MKILMTGGAGYIGSHAAVMCAQAGHAVTVLDNLCNSSERVVGRIRELAGVPVGFVKQDVRDAQGLSAVFQAGQFDAVMHFAGLKAVGESVQDPLRYFDNNVHGTGVLLQAMREHGVFKLVFSSSATVYGAATQMPLSEDATVGGVSNPYGRSKWMVEQVLQDVAATDPRWAFAVLRYFNPVGAHPSGMLGEDPKGIPNNLVPYVAQVAVGRLQALQVYGSDYPTPDGTGVRDYIHVQDLVQGHVAALNYLADHPGWQVWNLGTGQGYSVLQVVRAFEQASGTSIPTHMVGRRSGDVAESWANPSKALQQLGWKAQLGLQQMMQDHWRWQQLNPKGFEA